MDGEESNTERSKSHNRRAWGKCPSGNVGMMSVLPATFRVRAITRPKAHSRLPLRQKSPLHEKNASARIMILTAGPVALCRASQVFRNSHPCHRLPPNEFFTRIWFLFLRWKPTCPSPPLPLSTTSHTHQEVYAYAS